jgi:hypothetical protein
MLQRTCIVYQNNIYVHDNKLISNIDIELVFQMIVIFAYLTLYTLIAYGIYSKLTSTVPDNKRLEFTFRTVSISIQLYAVFVALITGYIYPSHDDTKNLIIALPLLAYFIFDTVTMPIYYSFMVGLPFLIHHIICICLGSYGLYATAEYRHILYTIVILYEFTGAAINLQWLLPRLGYAKSWCYTINGWFIVIGYLSFRFGLYLGYLYHKYDALQLNEKYVTVVFTILIGIFNIMAYPQVIKFCLPAVMPIKEL